MALAWTHRVEGFPHLESQKCVAADGLVVVLGFPDQEPCVLQSVLLDPRDFSWRYGPQLEDVYDTFCAAAVLRDVFVFYLRDTAEPRMVEVHRMDTETLQWTRVETSGEVLSGMFCVYAFVIDESLYLFGRKYFRCCQNPVEYALDARWLRIYSLDLTTYSWRFVDRYEAICFLQQSAIVGRCVYGPEVHNSGKSTVLTWWDSGTGQYGSIQLDKKCNFSVTNCTLLAYMDHLLVLHQVATRKTRLWEKWGSTALRYVVGDHQWTAPVPVYGEPPTGFYTERTVVVGDRAIFLLIPSTERDTPKGGEVRVLELAPGLRTLCLLAVRRHGLDASRLPRDLQRELQSLPPPPAPSPSSPRPSSSTGRKVSFPIGRSAAKRSRRRRNTSRR